MLIKTFTFEPDELDRFISFQYELYQHDKNWIPPLKVEAERMLQETYSFFTKGNLHCHFIAVEGKQVVGRITALVNKKLVNPDGTPIGLIGFYESIDDISVSSALFSRAIEWLKKQGIKNIWGPVNFDIWHSYRLMTRGFSEKRFYGEPYNKPWYPNHFINNGFTVKAEWDSVVITGRNTLLDMIRKGESRYKLLLDRGYRFETLQTVDYDKAIKKLTYIMSKSFGGFLGFTPILPYEIKQLFQKAYYAINPKMFLFTYNQDNKLVGFALALREIGEAVAAMRGKSTIISKVKFKHKLRKADTINFYLGGALPDEIKARSGLGRVGFYYIINQMLSEGYEKLLLPLRLKGNKVRALPGNLSPVPQREYALYERFV